MLLRTVLLAALAIPLVAGDAPAGRGGQRGIFATPLTAADLAPAGDAVWIDGKTSPVATMAKERHHVLSTATTGTHHQGIEYGAGRSPGARHLRLAFAREIPVGSVLSAGNGRLSVLKPGVAEWGDPGDEAQWLPAERLEGRAVSTAQPRAGGLTLWTLPPGTTTRALRFTHTPEPTDNDLEGRQGGVYILAERYANLAPQARIAVSAGATGARKLIDVRDNGWGTWDNGDDGADQPVTADRPVDIVLAFSAKAALRGIGTWACGASTADLSGLPTAGAMPAFGDPAWKTLLAAKGLVDGYPATLRSDWIDFGSAAELGALRLRLTSAAPERGLHPHIAGKRMAGKRVWLDEVIALLPLADRPLATAILPPWPETTAHAPIAVPFRLDEPGNVTLVIEDKDGKRIRNLCADTPFPAGDNTAWWDGLDDFGRDVKAAGHGLYHVPGTLVQPGTYRARGLVHPAVSLRYEFSPDDAGEPPWPTADNTGGWGTNHTPPSCAAFIPAARSVLDVPLVFIGSYVAEGGHGLFWVDPDGRKRGGVSWLGGTWTGAQTLAADLGPKAVATTAVYVTSGFNGEVRFTSLNRELKEEIIAKFALKTGADAKKPIKYGPTAEARPVAVETELAPEKASEVRDLAAHDGLLAATLPAIGEVWLVDAVVKQLVARVPLAEPGGIAFTADGTLLATSGGKLVKLDLPGLAEAREAGKGTAMLTPVVAVIATGLDQPRDLGLMADGNLTVSEGGERHQVRVLRPDGTVVRTIGVAGPPRVGPYDPLHLNHPAGVAADDRGRLWITEASTQPKRVGLWGADGKLQRAWYGPSRYGGGGTLDGFDRTLFYNNGMAFRLDWKAGTIIPDRVLWPEPTAARRAAGQQFPPDGHHGNGLPEFPHRVDGRRFFSNWHNSNPTNGSGLVAVWEDRDGQLKPIGAIGDPWNWNLLSSPAFDGCWPAKVKDLKNKPKLWCSWSDNDGDGVMQPGEVAIRPGDSGGITVQADLAFVLTLDDAIVRIPATVGKGRVSWAFDAPEKKLTGAQGPASSGGGTNLLMADGRIFAYPPPKPFTKHSVGSVDWSYPNMWPGLHPSHEAAVPDRPGMLIGPTRLLGLDATPRGGDAGPLVFLNQNMGNIAVFTSDGLMVATLFHDSRIAPRWRMPMRTRNMELSHLTLGDETFWPTMTQCQDDGSIYLCTGSGSTSSLVRVEGLEKSRRLPPRDIPVDAALLARCTAWQAELERERQKLNAPRQLAVPLVEKAPSVDGSLLDWGGAAWAVIDERGTRANFNSDSRPYSVHASLRIAGDRLYAAWRTTEEDLLVNSAEQPNGLFKTGSALDLMLGADPAAPADRQKPAPGDLRLIVTRQQAGGKVRNWAVLYRAVVPGTADGAKVPFSSPWRTITFDAVSEVTDEVEVAQKQGNYEVSVPLALLGLKPVAGQRLRGDLGVLRGSAGLTTQRVYWSNKATGITADVPSEAELQPGLWGTFELSAKDIASPGD